MDRAEILSPAGSFEGFLASVNAGADAVYFSLTKYGARAYADNFDVDKAIEALKISKLFGKRMYLTLNTLLKEDELAEIYDLLKPLYDNGLNGVIVQDLGLIKYLRDNFPALPIHLSTQLSLTGQDSARFFKSLGITRAVPARELSLKELKNIKNNTGIEIEAFIHGAMCYSYSGMCLMSSFLGGRSGNRGRCAQPCRLPYDLNGKSEKYPLSMKDMCTINILPEILSAGIDSLKIEGRMKRPEYAAGVTKIYRKYVDLFYSGKEYKVSKEDLSFLENLYIRAEISEGYYNKHNGADMVTLTSPAYKKTEEDTIESLNKEYIFIPRKDINISVCAKENENIRAKATCIIGDKTFEAETMGATVSRALNAPLSFENIKKQLEKTGDTYFQVKNTDITMDDNIFVPVKALNELRRELLNDLMKEICLNG